MNDRRARPSSARGVRLERDYVVQHVPQLALDDSRHVRALYIGLARARPRAETGFIRVVGKADHHRAEREVEKPSSPSRSLFAHEVHAGERLQLDFGAEEGRAAHERGRRRGRGRRAEPCLLVRESAEARDCVREHVGVVSGNVRFGFAGERGVWVYLEPDSVVSVGDRLDQRRPDARERVQNV